MGMKFLKAVYIIYIYLTKFEFLTTIISIIGTFSYICIYIYIYIWSVIKSLMFPLNAHNILIFMFYTLKIMYITQIFELIISNHVPKLITAIFKIHLPHLNHILTPYMCHCDIHIGPILLALPPCKDSIL